MKEEDIKELFEQFEAIANEYEGVECWSARELAQVLGYSQWRNFEGIIEKAKASCTNAGQEVSYHFAAEMTSVNVQQKDLHGQQSICQEHVDNNKAVRNMMLQRGIVPEDLPAGEDVKKVERRLKSDEKTLTKKNSKKK